MVTRWRTSEPRWVHGTKRLRAVIVRVGAMAAGRERDDGDPVPRTCRAARCVAGDAACEPPQHGQGKPLIAGRFCVTSTDRIRSQPMTEAEVKELIAAEVRKPMLEL